jgi:pimeloyl-ACP methyl ester carboxylesterase
MVVDVDGLSVNYRITGTGPRVAVILQGWGTTLDMYDSIAGALRPSFRVIQFDLPGFGGSDEPEEPWDVDHYADFFCHLMERLEVKEATLIGHSYGGRIIIKLAARDEIPFEIRDIVLVDSAGIMPKRTPEQQARIRRYKKLNRIASNKVVLALFPEIIEDWRSRQGSADYRAASPIMRRCLVLAVNEDLTGLLPRVRQNVLLIWGDQDDATPLEDGRTMERLMPNAGLVVLEGAGHYSYLDCPDKFVRILQSFLDVGEER